MTSRIGISMVVIAVVSLAVSSGGVSSVAVERPIEVAIADEESEQMVAFNGTGNDSTVEVTNRATADLTVEATLDESVNDSRSSNVTVRPPAKSIQPGETESIRVTGVSCDGVKPVPIDVRAATDSTTIETTVETTVACDE